MTDIAACERRLGVALDRIDKGLDRVFEAMRRPDPPPAATAEGVRQSLAGGAEAARLAAANDALIAANRELIAAGDSPDRIDAVRKALDAEIEALQAARAAEIAQMGEILAALETMLGVPASPPLPPDVPQAGFEGDAELLPQEGRVLRFGTSGEGDEEGR